MTMRAFKLSGVIAVGLLVGGCPERIPLDASGKRASTLAKELCKWRPAVSDVTKLLGLGISGLTTADAVAERICREIEARRSIPGDALRGLTIEGVEIRGKSVK